LQCAVQDTARHLPTPPSIHHHHLSVLSAEQRPLSSGFFSLFLSFAPTCRTNSHRYDTKMRKAAQNSGSGLVGQETEQTASQSKADRSQKCVSINNSALPLRALFFLLLFVYTFCNVVASSSSIEFQVCALYNTARSRIKRFSHSRSTDCSTSSQWPT